MRYSKLVKVYEKLESNASKLKKRDIIASFLKKCPSNLLETVTMLLRGRVFPDWMEEELGVAESTVIKTIMKVTGISEKNIKQEVRKAGDFGTATAALLGNKKQQTLFKEDISVEHVHGNLLKIPELTGSGSVNRKISLLSDLLSSATPEESVYMVRTVLQELRVGVGEGIIRDAVAKAFDVKVDAVEYAHNIRNDFGEVARIAKESGNSGLKKVTLSIGRPIKPMLAQKVQSAKEGLDNMGGKAALEYKYDGMRCISGYTPIYVKDRGIISVRDVKVGDYVLTHMGRYKKVIDKNVRTIDKRERVFRFQSFLGNEFKITEKHRLRVCINGIEKWVPVENVPDDAELVFPIPKKPINKEFPSSLILKTIDGYEKEFKLNKNFFRFVGCWVGDGYTNEYNKTHRIGVTFNKKDIEKIEAYKEIIKKEFKIKNISEYSHNGGVAIYWTDTPMMKWLSKNFRKKQTGWKGKRLPEWFWKIPKDKFFEFITGWIDADGHTDKYGRTSITTKEKQLATLAQLIALRFGKIIGLKKIRVSGKTYYKLMLTKSNRNAIIRNNKLFVKILKKEELKRTHPREVDPRQKVYNLQVDGDESYCTTMASLHNCQIHKKGRRVLLFTRRLDEITKQFPEIVDYARKAITVDNVIIEGEVVGMNKKTGKPLPFQKLSKRIKRKYDIEDMVKEIPVEMNLFDVVFCNGKDVLNEPFSKRREILTSLVIPIEGKFHLAEQIVTSKEKDAIKFYEKALASGQEGIMIKNLDAPYTPGSRVRHMYKLKPEQETLDLVIIGALWGEGRRSKWLGSFIIGALDAESGEFVEVGKVATGLTDGDLENLTQVLEPWVIESEKVSEVSIQPKLVVEVGYEEIQRSPTYESGFALRFPRVKRIREDKGSEDVDTLERISKLYELQK